MAFIEMDFASGGSSKIGTGKLIEKLQTSDSTKAFGSTPITSSYAQYNAFDGNTSTWYNSMTDSSYHYVGYQFTNPVYVKKVVFYTSNDTSNIPKSVAIQGSNDGTDFENLHNENLQFSASATNTALFDGIKPYKYIRLIATDINRNSTYPYNLSINELEFWGFEE